MIRRPGLPLPAVWDKGTAMGDIELPPDLVRTETNAYLPCKGGDHRDGLAGDALEWAQRSESRLNTALLKDAHIDGEGVKAAGQQLGSQGPLPSAGLNAFERVSWAGGWAVDTREDQILERAQALRRDLRTYIGRSMTADNDSK